MEIKTINCGFLETNCYIISDEDHTVVFDPESETEKIISAIGSKKLMAVILTHGHFDHIGDVDKLCSITKAPLYIHAVDAEMLTDTYKNGSFLIPGLKVTCNTPSNTFTHGDKFTFGSINIEVIHTPGHTKGSCCFVCGDYMISGDTLFRNGIGRTDLYGGDTATEYESISKLFRLAKDYTVFPGHGPKTTLKKEKRGLI